MHYFNVLIYNVFLTVKGLDAGPFIFVYSFLLPCSSILLRRHILAAIIRSYQSVRFIQQANLADLIPAARGCLRGEANAWRFFVFWRNSL
jgi:hypothetical protein